MAKISKRRLEIARHYHGELAELSKWPDGAGPIAGVMDGQRMSSLADNGLAERLPADPTDRIGGPRYRISPAGRQALKEANYDR